MSWREDYEAKQLAIKVELDAIMSSGVFSKEELDKRFLKDFGCINFKDNDFYHVLDLAREYHKRMMKVFPDKHCIEELEPYRCYHVTRCSCGFCEACDSSD